MGLGVWERKLSWVKANYTGGSEYTSLKDLGCSLWLSLLQVWECLLRKYLSIIESDWENKVLAYLQDQKFFFLLEKLSLDEESFHHFFCLEFLCFLGKAIRKLVRKATLVASRILRFPWLNPSGFSPKCSRQAALLALINYIFQMIDQGTVMYTNHFWSHLNSLFCCFLNSCDNSVCPHCCGLSFHQRSQKRKRFLAWLWHLMLSAP